MTEKLSVEFYKDKDFYKLQLLSSGKSHHIHINKNNEFIYDVFIQRKRSYNLPIREFNRIVKDIKNSKIKFKKSINSHLNRISLQSQILN